MGFNKNFVVRNGLEVASTLLYADDENNRVGINSANPAYDLEVVGNTKLDGAIVSSADTTGLSNQYLKSTGTGWEWETFPTNRLTETYTLTAGQSRIPDAGTFPGFTLVEYAQTSLYLDGVKLGAGDYTIEPGGGFVTLVAPAFGGEEVELIAHGATSVGTGNTGILGVSARRAGIESGDPGRITILDFVGLGVTLDGRAGLVTVHISSGGLTEVSSDPSPDLGGYLNLNNRGIFGTGIVTATKFVGNGAELTGITTLIQAGNNINITTFSGITTINANVPTLSGVFGALSNDSTVGIFTNAPLVGLGTTNPRFQTEIGPVGSSSTTLWVNGNGWFTGDATISGDARVTGILTVGSSSVTINGNTDEITIGSAVTLTSSGEAQFTGVVTASGFDGDLVGQHKIFTSGVSNSDDYTLAMLLNPTQGGHSFMRYDLGGKLQYNPSTGQLSNVGIISATGVNITGISTFVDQVNFQTNINLGTNDIINVGSSNDLQIYHDGSNAYLDDQGTGDLILNSPNAVRVQNTGQDMGVFNANASVELYYDRFKKFETISTGATITGTLYATQVEASGSITANTFVGDGSGLTGVVGSGSGVIVRDSGSLVGTAGTIDFSTGLSVSPVSSGIVTVTSSGAVGSAGTWAINSIGIHTSKNVGINTNLSTDALTVVGDGNFTGVVTATSFSGNISVEASSDNSSFYPVFVTSGSGSKTLYNDTGLSYNPSTNVLSSFNQRLDGYLSLNDNVELYFGNSNDAWFNYNGSGNYLELQLESAATDFRITDNGTERFRFVKSTGRLGIATTNPQTPLQVENVYGVKTGSGSFTASAGIAYTADSYGVSDFVNAEYTLFFQHSGGIQSQKVLVMDDGSTAYSQEYGIMNSNDLLVSVGATVKSGNVELWWTPESGVSGIVTYRYTRETMI